MTPDVVVDVGNSRIKWMAWRDRRTMATLPPDDEAAWDRQLDEQQIDGPLNWAAAGVHPARLDRFVAWAVARGDYVRILAHPDISLAVDVDEPAKVGIDRLLGAVAALRRFPPGTPVVVFGVGSAMTMDYLDPDGVFRGGAILPGPWMMARALHEFTAKLPLVDPWTIEPAETIGRNTTQAIQSGIQAALIGAAEAFVWNVSQALGVKKPAVVVTGGGQHFLRGLWHGTDLDDLEYVPALTLDGIRIAAEGLPS